MINDINFLKIKYSPLYQYSSIADNFNDTLEQLQQDKETIEYEERIWII